MVYISRVYTRSGDDGGTMLATGDRVSKDHLRIRAYGDVDELNCVLGLLRAELQRDPLRGRYPDTAGLLDEQLGRIQQELFDLGAELATPTADGTLPSLALDAGASERLEQQIDGLNAPLEPLKSFVLPGGSGVNATAHLARTVCRRAERQAVALAHHEPVRPDVLRYLNRLSDYLFVLARRSAADRGDAEVIWVQRRRPEVTP